VPAALSRLAALGHLDGLDRVASDRLVIDGARQRGAERVTRVFAASCGKRSTTAFPDCAAAPLVLKPRGVFSLRAALADGSELVQPLPDILHLYFVEVLTAQVRDDVQTGDVRRRGAKAGKR
jgi:hypothetical protein